MPYQVEQYVKSATHNASGRAAVKLRLTRSGARTAVGSDLAVKRFLARLAPRMPWARMSRGTWSRPMSRSALRAGLPEPAAAIDRVGVFPERGQRGAQLGVAQCPVRRRPGLGGVIGGGGELQLRADRLDPPSTPTSPVVPVGVDE